jgi:phage shock protein C
MASAQQPKRLYLSDTDKKIMGVCGGIAEYLSVDSTFVRIIAVILLFVSGGAAFFAYLIVGLIMPKHPEVPQGPIEKS